MSSNYHFLVIVECADIGLIHQCAWGLLLKNHDNSLEYMSYTEHCNDFTFIVCFLLGNSPASEFYMPTFRNTLSVPSS
jgi:hypothetical protein